MLRKTHLTNCKNSDLITITCPTCWLFCQDGKLPSQCLKEGHCKALQTSFFECKRSMVSLHYTSCSASCMFYPDVTSHLNVTDIYICPRPSPAVVFMSERQTLDPFPEFLSEKGYREIIWDSCLKQILTSLCPLSPAGHEVTIQRKERILRNQWNADVIAWLRFLVGQL